MAEDKRDWLSLCNETKIPFQDFMAGWCSRCFQAECSRSLHGKSKFEDRAANWEDRLFNQVSKLDPNDERFKEIVAKRFLPIAPGQAHTPSAWMDPRDIEPVREISIPKPPELVLPPVPAVVAREELPVKMEETPAPPAPAPPPAAPAAEPALRNTAAKPRQMIGGAEAKPAQPVLNPWAPKQPLRPDDTLVQPGARIKLTR